MTSPKQTPPTSSLPTSSSEARTAGGCADCTPAGAAPEQQGGEPTGAKHSLRRWVKLAVFLGCAGVIVSLAVSRERMSDSLHLIKAQKMVKSERWDEAYTSYRKLVPKHQGDTDVLLSYAEAAVRTGHHEDASRALLVIHGRQATDRQVRRAGQVLAALERAGHKAPAAPAPVPLTMY